MRQMALRCYCKRYAACPPTKCWRFASMNIGYTHLATIFVACLAIRGGYAVLKESHRINPESKPIFLLILTVMLILWLAWFTLCPQDPYPLEVPEFIRWIGLGVFGLGLILAVGALIQLRGVENINHLVTTGLFKKIRWLPM